MEHFVKIESPKSSIQICNDDYKPDSLPMLLEEIRESPSLDIAITIKGCGDLLSELLCSTWRLCRELTQYGHKIRLKIDGRRYKNPVDFAARQLSSLDDPLKHAKQLTMAIDCAANYCTDSAVEAAAGQLCRQLKEHGISFRSDRLARRIREKQKGPLHNSQGNDFVSLAQQFVASQWHDAPPETTVSSIPAVVFQAPEFHCYRDGKWELLADAFFRAELVRFLQQRLAWHEVNTRMVNDVVTNLTGLTHLATQEPSPFFIDEFGPVPRISRRNLIAFKNGILDMDAVVEGGLEVQAHTPQWFCANRLDYPLDPSAKATRWRKFLYEVLEIDPATKRFRRKGDRRLWVLQEFFGYCLLPGCSYQKLLIMFGRGSNGKSIVLSMLNAMLGEHQVSNQSLDQLGSRFGLEPLYGKLANICGDLNDVDRTAEGVIKRLTGGDNLTIERKNCHSLTMFPGIKLVFSANSLPRFRDDTDGVWRRLITMPFDLQIADDRQDVSLANRLKAELPGIVAWAIEGLQRLLKQGGFTKCGVCEAAKSRYRKDCDPIAQFIDEAVVYGPGYRVTVPQLYGHYADWCQRNGERAVAAAKFSERVAKIDGIKRLRDTVAPRHYYFTGLQMAAGFPASSGEPARSMHMRNGFGANGTTPRLPLSN